MSRVTRVLSAAARARAVGHRWRAPRRHCSQWHVRPPERPILHQRIEEAAREGDIDKVRRILAEADGAASYNAPSRSSQANGMAMVLAYALSNLIATAYDYHITSKRASEQLRQTGEADVTLKLQSFSFVADLEVGGASSEPSSSVLVVPHIYVTDLVFGRTKWMLHCSKGAGHTQWKTEPR